MSPLFVPDSDQRKNEYAAWRGTAGTTTCRDNFPDRVMGYSITGLMTTTGVMENVGIVLYAGDIISNIVFRSGSTAANTPTHWWFALYDTAKNLMSQTADQLTNGFPANTTSDLALGSPQTIVTTGLYYASVMMAATTLITLEGFAGTAGNIGINGLVTGQAMKCSTSGSGLTTTAPATIASPASFSTTVPLVTVHD